MTLADEYLVDREIYTIEEIGGVKHIHFQGYGYPNEEGGFTFLHRIGACIPLEEAIKEFEEKRWDRFITDIDNNYKQYEDDVDSLYDYVGDVANCELNKLSMSMPCGTYESWIG